MLSVVFRHQGRMDQHDKKIFQEEPSRNKQITPKIKIIGKFTCYRRKL